MRRFPRRRNSRNFVTLVGGWLLALGFLAVLIAFAPSFRVVGKGFLQDVSAALESLLEPALVTVMPSYESPGSPSMLDSHFELLAFAESAAIRPEQWVRVTPEASSQGTEAASDPATTNPASIVWGTSSIDFVKAPFTSASGIWLAHLRDRSEGTPASMNEILEVPVIPLLPGQTVTLVPDPHAEGLDKGTSSPQRLTKDLALYIICVGATPDRLDAPGALDVVGEVSNGDELPSTVSVSHAPRVAFVPLTMASNLSPNKIRLTWGAGSSGTLLILGLVERPSGAQAEHTSQNAQNSKSGSNGVHGSAAGALYVTANEVWAKGNAFAETAAQLEQRKAPLPLLVANLWPERADPFRNEEALTQRLRSPSGIVKSYPFVHRVDVVVSPEAEHSLKEIPQLAADEVSGVPSRSMMTFDRFEGREGLLPGLPAVVRLIQLGGFVHLNFVVTEGGAPLESFVDAGRVRALGEVVRGRMDAATLRMASMFARPSDFVFMSRREQSLMLDAALARTIDTVDRAAEVAAAPPSDNAEPLSARVPTTRGYAPIVIQASQVTGSSGSAESMGQGASTGLPVDFVPGAAWVSPVDLGTEVPWQDQQPAGVSQQEFLGWLGEHVWRTPQRESQGSKTERMSAAESKLGSPASGGREVLATTEGDDGKLYVFPQGWVFLPRMNLEQRDGGLRQSPIYRLPTDEVLAAKQAIFQMESVSQRLRLDVVLQSANVSRRVEIRSEFPILQCSSSRESVSFAKVFGQDGAMTVTADVKGDSESEMNLETPRTVLSCVVDKSVRNPVPKPRSERLEKPDEARLRADAKAKADARAERIRLGLRPDVSDVATLTLRITEDGKKLPLNEIAVGPYLESAEVSASDGARSRSAVQFDLAKDFRRLLTLVTPVWDSKSFKVVVLVSADSGIESDHPLVEDWSPEVENFLQERVKLAERVRANKL